MRNLPECSVGDEIEYQIKKRLKGYLRKTGKVIAKTDLFITVMLPAKFGSYPDTIHKNDLITGDYKIIAVRHITPPASPEAAPGVQEKPSSVTEKALSVKENEHSGQQDNPSEQTAIPLMKGEKKVSNKNKLPVPPAEVLADLFEKGGRNITKAAQMHDPVVSDVTMGKWLREAGLIPETTERSKHTAPPANELRTAWEESKYTLVALGRKYGVSGTIAKRWLKAAGIIIDGPTGIQNVAAVDNHPDKTGQGAGFAPEDDEQIPYTVNQEPNSDENTPPEPNPGEVPSVDQSHEHEIIKKLLDFHQVPLLCRLEKLENDIAQGRNASRLDIIDIIADLIICIVRRSQLCQEANEK